MNNTATMSATKKRMTEQQRLRKMSKAQLQLAIAKKKECDAKALTIVEQLLESQVNPDWLLQNLGFISKSHMEDAIEERAIVKLCGYVLCSNQLTVVIRQQYHISTRKNKVYDISKRKNFCSSLCYGAANYLLEQMLESPLWLRETEDIPVFQILPVNSKPVQCGDEIDVTGVNLSQNIDADNEKSIERGRTKQMKKDAVCNISSPEEENTCNSHLLNNSQSDKISNNGQRVRKSFTNNSLSTDDSTANEINQSLQKLTQDDRYQQFCKKLQDKNDTNEKLQPQLVEISNLKNDENERRSEPQSSETNSSPNDENERSEPQSSETNSSPNDENERSEPQSSETNSSPNDEKRIQPQLDKTCSSNNNTVLSSVSTHSEYEKTGETSRINKSKKYKLKKIDNAETQNNICLKLAMHVEQSVREWVTKNTLCLLLGEVDERNRLLEKLTQYDRYQQLYKKLNKLQLEDEKEDRVDLERDELKPLPNFSVLKEDAKGMELKVRAFYEGRITITPDTITTSSEDSSKESGSKANDEPILPLTDAHTPNALRRRIFLDNLNKILPDLLRALTSNANISSLVQCTYNNEKYSLIKILISTFNLSAANIVFKTAEWTLVGLVVIKMLSLMDTQLQLLLRTRQASMYMSMILTTYKLDSNYLDRLIMEITNKNVHTPKSSDE